MRQIVLARHRSFLVAFLPLLGACTAEPQPPRVLDKATIEITDDVRDVAVHSNEFAFDLYERLRKTEGNLFFSPASVSTALAMTYAGAGGETKQQIARVLHLDAADERVHNGFGQMARILHSDGERYQLRMANRLWGSEGYPFRPAFLTLTREAYGAELAQVDFNKPDNAARTINDWIAEQTEGKIGQLISPGMIRPRTRLVLTNAIYFNAAWQDEFWKGATEEAAFHLSADKEISVPMMRQVEHFSYTETDDEQILELPYVGGDLSMVVVLPKRTDGLPKLEQTASARRLDEWIAAFESRRVEVFLPKFRIAWQLPLTDHLKSMGMASAFKDDADFSGMSSVEDLKIYAVLHAAFVDVDEEGTEAAAATAVMTDGTSEPPGEEEPAVFRADHAFMFLIRDARSGAILFLSRLANPAE